MRTGIRICSAVFCVICSCTVSLGSDLFLTRSFYKLVYDEPRSNDFKNEEKRAATEMFRVYLKLEEEQDYSGIYDLLSSRYRSELQRKFKVKDASDYRTFRLSSEARWHHFRTLKIEQLGRNRFRFLVRAKVEETGITEEPRMTFYVVKEGSGWKIDGWNY